MKHAHSGKNSNIVGLAFKNFTEYHIELRSQACTVVDKFWTHPFAGLMFSFSCSFR